MDIDELGLTDKELEKANGIISGIQEDLNKAIEELTKGDYDKALSYINSGISKSNCPICKKELGILIADISHTKAICILGADSCEAEKNELVDIAKELKDEFVPLTTTKKASKDAKTERVDKILTSFRLPPLLRRRISD